MVSFGSDEPKTFLIHVQRELFVECISFGIE